MTADDRTWLFMCVSILWVKESLQLLRRGRLNGLCNQLKSVIAAVEVCHHALFYEFGRYSHPLTAHHISYIFKACLCHILYIRRLVSCPSKHHAIHIAELRKSLDSDPASILRAYDKARESSGGHSSALVYNDSVAIKVDGNNNTHIKSEVEGQEEEAVVDFDDLNTIETDQKDAADNLATRHNTHDTTLRTGNSGGAGGGLSGLLGLGFGQGNSKEDKFRVP